MIFDGHSDIFTHVTNLRAKGEHNILDKYHYQKLKDGGIEGGNFVIWVEPMYKDDYAGRTKQIRQAIRDEMNETTNFTIVHSFEEAMQAKADGKFYIFLGCEGLADIGHDLDKIYEYRDFGVKTAMLTWNELNELAAGAMIDNSKGLTIDGKKAVGILQECGIMVDVSHLNEHSFWDVLDVSTKPIVASHSNVKSLCDVSRNLNDRQIEAIMQVNGVIGLNTFNEFVSKDREKQTVDEFMKHLIYLCEKTSTKHVAFGFDYFEYLSEDCVNMLSSQNESYTNGLEDCTKSRLLVDLLEKYGFSKQDIQDICVDNWRRVYNSVIDK